ncbi:MAG: helicase-associated domain-containing protein [Sandaracinaceae bacterium]
MPTCVSDQRPAIVQGDRTVLLEVDHPGYDAARKQLARFAELEKSPEHVHTYRVGDLSLWNAAAAGLTADEVLSALRAMSRFPVPSHVEHEIMDRMARHGVCSLHDHPSDPSKLRLAVREPGVRQRLAANRKLSERLAPCPDGFFIDLIDRGPVKQSILKLGWPVDDRAGLREGAPLEVGLRQDVFVPYPHQLAARDAFLDAGSHGVIVLPCGAGKTVLAMMAIAALKTRTLVLTSGREACTQWRRELLAKTTLGEDDVAVYASGSHRVAPVTISTYAMMARRGGAGPTKHVHFDRVAGEPWGLVVYDEVHLLPAPMFRLTAEMQAHRRLGLTATLVREDGRASDVFALIGPKRYDVPWRELEASGHIANATCFEVRVDMPASLAGDYASASLREQPRIAAENPAKLRALAEIARRHEGDRLLVLGSYLAPLDAAGRLLSAPVITGSTPHAERETLLEGFREGDISRLVLSRVGNFALDLPEANVMIQISGTMGSRQEEAQRLGRILRPKAGGATFYSLVSRDTVEQQHALHRQLFLTEQGYRYYLEDWSDGPEEEGATLH